MVASAQMAHVATPDIRAFQKPYAVLLLPAVLDGKPDQHELLLPLTLAYLLSVHVPFRFPLHERALPIVERAFDNILRGLPKESMGICYQPVDAPERAFTSLATSSLLLASEPLLPQLQDSQTIPAAILSKTEGKGHLLRLRNLEKIENVALRGKLAGCAQLINVQSSGFITEGPFSLSW